MQLLTSVASAPFGPLELTHSWMFLAVVTRVLSIAALVAALLVIGTLINRCSEKGEARWNQKCTFITLGAILMVVLTWTAAAVTLSWESNQSDAQRHAWNMQVSQWAAAEYGVTAGVEDFETPHWEVCSVNADTCYTGLLMAHGQPVQADLIFVGDQPVLLHHDGAHEGEQLAKTSD